MLVARDSMVGTIELPQGYEPRSRSTEGGSTGVPREAMAVNVLAQSDSHKTLQSLKSVRLCQQFWGVSIGGVLAPRDEQISVQHLKQHC